MAIVYQAYDTRLETHVAVKVIRMENLTAESRGRALKRFEREAKALARLTHPNIVKVMDYGEFEGMPYLVMPYLQGGTLKRRLGRKIPWQEAIQILLPIARALEYAHQENVIHRDVKPSNILLTESDQPMLSDFGVAKILSVQGTADLTAAGMGIGTPEYMAPEQWDGQAGPQVDVYALGAVFYEMVTGRKPYTAETPAAILFKLANDPLPRPGDFVSNLPDAVESILFKALAKQAENRYPSMAALAFAMEEALVESPTLAGARWPFVRAKPAGRPEVADKTRTNTEAAAFARPRLDLRRWWGWGGALVIMALGVFAYLALGVPRTAGPISTQTLPPPSRTIQAPASVTPPPTWTSMPVIAPSRTMAPSMGGGRLSYLCLDGQRVWIETIDSPGTPPSLSELPLDHLPIASGFSVPLFYWSPDGTQLLFFDAASTFVFDRVGGKLSLISDSAADSVITSYVPMEWSPDGRYLAFEAKRSTVGTSITFIRSDGQARTTLANGYHPAWSPNGKWIGYTDGERVLYFTTLSGVETTRVGEGDAMFWAPSGKWIAYVKGGRSPDQAVLHLYDVEGGGDAAPLAVRVIGSNYVGYTAIAWSPDENWIAFRRTDGIYVIDPIGKAERKVDGYSQEFSGSSSESAGGLFWSPDGQKILVNSFAWDGKQRTSNLFVVDVQGGERVELGEGIFSAWSPDSRLVAFSSERDGSEALYVAATDGSDVSRLGEAHFKCMSPVWVSRGADD